MLLASTIFAFFCWGLPCWKRNKSMLKQQRSNRKQLADYEKMTTEEFFVFAEGGRSLTATILPLDLAGIEVESDLISRAS